MSNNKGITDDIRLMEVGDKITMQGIERPNIHALATRVGRKVKAKKQKDGSFVVECIAIYEDLG